MKRTVSVWVRLLLYCPLGGISSRLALRFNKPDPWPFEPGSQGATPQGYFLDLLDGVRLEFLVMTYRSLGKEVHDQRAEPASGRADVFGPKIK